MMYRKGRNSGPSVRIFMNGSEGCAGRSWHMRHRHGHSRGGGNRSGVRRALDHGHLRLRMLQLIAEAPRHGYDLIREIEARTEGAYVPSPGVIYPTLEALQDLGFVAAEADGTRRSFRITPDGEAELAREAETLAQIHERLGALQASEMPEDPEDVRGAMHRLRHSVIREIRGYSGDAARRRAVAEILTEAQERIAKLSDD